MIQALQKAILDLHSCESEHSETVPIKEKFEGQTVWETVFEIPPVDSPQSAVKASIVGEFKS